MRKKMNFAGHCTTLRTTLHPRFTLYAVPMLINCYVVFCNLMVFPVHDSSTHDSPPPNATPWWVVYGYRAFGPTMYIAAFFKLAQDLLAFVQPVLLEQFINYIETRNKPDDADKDPQEVGWELVCGAVDRHCGCFLSFLRAYACAQSADVTLGARGGDEALLES